MCGIAGIHAYRPAAPSVDHAELRRMRDHMAARGPEGLGQWHSPDGRVGLDDRLDVELGRAGPAVGVELRVLELPLGDELRPGVVLAEGLPGEEPAAADAARGGGT